MNDKERILRAARHKKITYNGIPIRLSVDLSAETLQARREWIDIFKTLKDKNLQPRILHPAKISFRCEGEITSFPDKQKLRDFITMRPPPAPTTRNPQEGEEKENVAESMLQEIIAENFQNLGNEREICLEEASRSPRFVYVKRPTARHIVVKPGKMNDKERILRAARQKKITYKGTPISLSADFSAETLQAGSEWNAIFKSLKDKNFQPRILHPAKISFRYDGETKTLPDKPKLREFKPEDPHQEILKKALIPGNKNKNREKGVTKLRVRR